MDSALVLRDSVLFFGLAMSASTDTKPHQPKHPKKKSVQAYIDETPFWEDGTEVADAAMSAA